MPCPGPFHFSHSLDYIYEFCPLPDPDVDISIFVCDVEHISIFVCDVEHTYVYVYYVVVLSMLGLRGRKFVLCLFGQCPGL